VSKAHAATQSDVARAAGVSRSLVSLALSGSPKVAAGTRERIEEVAASLGYRVNVSASSLARKRSTIIGLVLPNLRNAFFEQIAACLGRAAAAREVIHGVRVLLAAGFALQVLAGALSYLSPVMLGGGPAATRATNAIMDRAAAYRVVAANACLALALLTVLPWEVRVSGAVTAGAIAAYVPIGMGLSVREVVVRAREKKRGAAVTIPGDPPAAAPGASSSRMPVSSVRQPHPRAENGQAGSIPAPSAPGERR